MNENYFFHFFTDELENISYISMHQISVTKQMLRFLISFGGNELLYKEHVNWKMKKKRNENLTITVI